LFLTDLLFLFNKQVVECVLLQVCNQIIAGCSKKFGGEGIKALLLLRIGTPVRSTVQLLPTEVSSIFSFKCRKSAENCSYTQ